MCIEGSIILLESKETNKIAAARAYKTCKLFQVHQFTIFRYQDFSGVLFNVFCCLTSSLPELPRIGRTYVTEYLILGPQQLAELTKLSRSGWSWKLCSLEPFVALCDIYQTTCRHHYITTHLSTYTRSMESSHHAT